MPESYSYDHRDPNSSDPASQSSAPATDGASSAQPGAGAPPEESAAAAPSAPASAGATRGSREYGLPAPADAHGPAVSHASTPSSTGAPTDPYADTGHDAREGDGAAGGDASFDPAHPPKPAPGTDLSSDVGAALNFAYRAFVANPLAFIVPGVIYFVVILGLIVSSVIVGFVVFFSSVDAWVASGSDDVPLRPLLILYAIMFVGALLAMPFSLLWSTGAAAAGDKIVEGTKPSIRDSLLAPGRVILTALLVGLITTVGMLLCYLPGLVASAFLIFAVPAAARGASPVAAVKESIALVRSNLGTALLTWLVVQVIASVGGSLVITLVIVIPAAYLFELAMFERMNGRELPDPRAEEQAQTSGQGTVTPVA
ncbi:hypothetical protein [Brachybacterium timonense]|uniref:hypothetical protein n=1 Tax=Brachybacterium timonense TaxID=2050896 RepID=UPI000D0B4D43|nr:hypothetical protein [Brachybacterium timonense]